MDHIRIVGGRLIDPSSGIDAPRDVLLADGVVSAVEKPGKLPAPGQGDRTVDASGRWVVPGLVDMHVHLREPGDEHKEDIASGLGAAVKGGFSSVCAMPNTDPVNDTRAVTEMIRRKAERLGLARLYPVAAITRALAGKELTEMGDLTDAGAVAFSDDGRCVSGSGTMRCALEYALSFGTVIIQHAQDPDLSAGGLTHEGPLGTRLGMGGWPSAAEEVIVARDIVLARLTGSRYHVAHVSCAGTVGMLRQAKAEGLPVSSEVTVNHLLLTDADTAGYDTLTKVSPPFRTAGDRQALLDGLREGVIDAVVTDHAPHALLDKEGDYRSASFGISGLDTSVSLMLGLVESGDLTPMQMIRAMSTAPARVLGLPAGTLSVGAAGDVTVIDPADPHVIDPKTFVSKGKNTPFAGRRVPGRAVMTIVAGRVVFERQG